MKKRIIIGIFSALILITIVAILAVLISACNLDYEADPNAKYAALGAYMFMFLGGCVVFYECDLFYTVYNLLVRPQTTLKTALNILSHLSLFFATISVSLVYWLPDSLGRSAWLRVDETVTTILILTYIVLRMIYLLVIAFSSVEET